MKSSPKILLTGSPGVGKTTVVRKVVERTKRKAMGFYTQEMRRDGVRVGFEVRILSRGESFVLAHIGIRSASRVGKYGVDVGTFENVACEEIEEGLRAGAILVVDEIGRMELFSERFRELVEKALDSDSLLLGTILQRDDPFGDWAKGRGDVEVMEVTRENRDSLVETVVGMMGA